MVIRPQRVLILGGLLAAAILLNRVGPTRAAEGVGFASAPANQPSRPGRPQDGVTAAEREKIERAIPAQAPARPAKRRKLLIFDCNVGYGGHPSAAHANLAFTLMGQKTGAFEALLRHDPEAFAAENLKQFDAVFFNNTVGNLFEDPTLRRNLLEFVSGGGGLMGVHGATVAFTRWPGAHEDWPQFGELLGARGASHRDSNERVFIKVEDPAHPLVRAFGGKGFEYRDEFFRVHEPYSREKLRVLLSIDTQQTDLNQGQARGNCQRADNDYALAWVRSWGKGRVFYCTIAHNPYVFWDPKLLEFYLAAAQFVLGDLPADTTPSAKLGTSGGQTEQLGVPRIDPDYTLEVDQWWAAHPFNPDSPNYSPEIRSPQPVVTLASGQSIQEAVDRLPQSGGTIKLGAGTYQGFQIIGRGNIHVISDGQAVIHGPSVIAVCQEALDYGKMDWLVSHAGPLKYKDQRVWELYKRPVKNFYFRNLIFDGQQQQTSGIALKRAYDVVFDRCVFRNFRNPRKGHGGNAWGHMGLNNIWFRECHFAGSGVFATYLDGAHGCGMIRCTIAGPQYSSGTFLFLTNHDFTDDLNENGRIDRPEERSAKYVVVYGNTYQGDTYSFAQFTGENFLIAQNTCTGNVVRMAASDPPGPIASGSLRHGVYNVKVLGNTAQNVAEAILVSRVAKDRLDEVLQAPQRARYTIQDNRTQNEPQPVKYGVYP